MLKELEDYKWFPAQLRRWQMDYIGNMVGWLNLYRPLVPVIEQLIQQNRIAVFHDTCSGNGYAAMFINNHLKNKLPLLLTDKYPDASFRNLPGIVYSMHPVDVLCMVGVENCLYSMYNAFHHFTEKQQKAFVKNMAESKCPFIIAEILEPGFLQCCKILFATTFLQIILGPFVKPFSLLRLFFTYIIPVNLITIAWDGIISVLKSKSAKQYEMLLMDLKSDSFLITVNKITNWKGNIIYIKGELAIT